MGTPTVTLRLWAELVSMSAAWSDTNSRSDIPVRYRFRICLADRKPIQVRCSQPKALLAFTTFADKLDSRLYKRRSLAWRVANSRSIQRHRDNEILLAWTLRGIPFDAFPNYFERDWLARPSCRCHLRRIVDVCSSRRPFQQQLQALLIGV